MPSHRWLLTWEDIVEDHMRSLPKHDRNVFFTIMSELASMENPYSYSGIEKLVEKRFEGQRRVRHGDYRMRFMTDVGEVIENNYAYKGKLIILAVENRKEAYRRK